MIFERQVKNNVDDPKFTGPKLKMSSAARANSDYLRSMIFDYRLALKNLIAQHGSFVGVNAQRPKL
jgi:hypothetical protein